MRGVHEVRFRRLCRALVAGSKNQPSRRSLCGFGTGSAKGIASHRASLFALEIANVVAKVEAKGIVSEADSQRFISLMGQLELVTDIETTAHALGDTLNLARRYRLSAYDAAYLELALRRGLPLATLDADLAQAATRAGLPIFAIH